MTLEDRDLAQLRLSMHRVRDLLRDVDTHLADVWSLAFEQRVGERSVRRQQSEGYAHTDTGDPKAKEAIRSLMKTTDASTVALQAVLHQARNLLVGGEGSDSKLRGTLLGEAEGDTPKTEMARLEAAQERRRDRGDYTPHRMAPQPKVPGT